MLGLKRIPQSLRLSAAMLGVAAATLGVYAGALTHDFVNYDDMAYVTENSSLNERTAAGLAAHFVAANAQGGHSLTYVMGNYHPLTMLSLHLDAWLSSPKPSEAPSANLFHLTNVVLHVANTLLVFLLVLALLRAQAAVAPAAAAPAGLQPLTAALVAALLFGVATVHVESVAWVSARKDVLYAFFFLLSLLAYLRFTRTGGGLFYGAALAAFVLALLAKAQAVTLAPTLLLIDHALGRPLTRRRLVALAPFFALALVGGLVAIDAQSTNILPPGTRYPIFVRPFLAAFALVQYVVKLLVPVHLRAVYPYSMAVDEGLSLYLVFFPLAVVLCAGGVYIARRSRLAAFGVGFFALSIAPVLQLLPVGPAVLADRYSYLASLGVCLLIGMAVASMVGRYPPRAPAVYAALGAYVVAIGALTLERVEVWRDGLTLWTAELHEDSRSLRAQMGIAMQLYRQGDLEGALDAATRAASLDEQALDPRYYRARILSDMGKASDAIVEWNAFVESHPDNALALNYRGMAKMESGDAVGAKDDFTRALQLVPDWSVYTNRALANQALKNHEAAIDDCSQAIALGAQGPGAHHPYLMRGKIRAASGDIHGAIADFSVVIRLQPSSPRAYLLRANQNLLAKDCVAAKDDLATVKKIGGTIPDDLQRVFGEVCPGPL